MKYWEWMEHRNYELKLLPTNDDWYQSIIMSLSCNLLDNCIILVYCLQGFYSLQAPVGSAELVCRMLHDPDIWCDAQLAPSYEIVRWKVSGKDDTLDFADDALEVIESAGIWVYAGYLPLRILKGYLGRSLAYVTCPHKWRIMGKTAEKM